MNLGGTFKRLTSIHTCSVNSNQQVSASQVKDCLSVGLSVGLGQVSASLSSDHCKKVLNNQGSVASYSEGFQNHITTVSGGEEWSGVFSMTQNDSAGFHRWLRSTKEKPALVSYKIRPLHDLVKNQVVKQHLQREIRAYIEKNGLPVEKERACSGPNLSPNCCPLHISRGSLMVTVIRAWALNIERFGPKDIHIKVFYGGIEQRTWDIHSYDPIWNAHFSYGHVDTGQLLRVQTWYRDWFKSGMVGECVRQIYQGSHQHDCWMNIGVFTYAYNLQCDPQLTGPQCNIFSRSP